MGFVAPELLENIRGMWNSIGNTDLREDFMWKYVVLGLFALAPLTRPTIPEPLRHRARTRHQTLQRKPDR